MNRELYTCVYAAEFPAQALLRLRPDLQSLPVAVLVGRAPQQTVCAMNRHARLCGATPGMTRLEAESIRGLHLLSRSADVETSARAVLLESAARFSPRIEDVSEGTACSCVLDITGTERLFGPSEYFAERLRISLVAAGFRVSIAVSANYHAACIKAASTRGTTLIPEGQEACALAKLPVVALSLAEEHQETFALWGIRTLGELAALNEVELITRLGPQARAWHERARGAASHVFQPIEPVFSLQEFCEFESPVEQIESLLFIGARMIDCLAARALERALSLASLSVDMKLDGGGIYQGAIRPALPTTDRKFLLKLLQLEIGVHPPSAAVVSLVLSAEAGQSRKMQLGLFAPRTPDPSRLDVTLARLKAIVGESRVGSPVLEDTHQAGSFRMERFSTNGNVSVPNSTSPRLALRRVRPPVPIRVALHAMRPAEFRDGRDRFEVAVAFGPWQTSGCWWSTGPWDAEEWDVLAVAGNGASVACLLVQDRKRKEWRLEAYYD
ncbi:MAG: DNA polymerase Y family protein [Terracidiphilus sp.]